MILYKGDLYFLLLHGIPPIHVLSRASVWRGCLDYKEMLDKFAKQCPPEDCNVEMLDYWLRKHVKHIDQHPSHSIW